MIIYRKTKYLVIFSIHITGLLDICLLFVKKVLQQGSDHQ